MKKKVLLTVGVALLSVVLIGCGASKKDDKAATGKDEKQKITFTWWGSETRHKGYIAAIELFEKENPNIDVEYEFSAWDDYWKKLATKAAAGELPDVVQMGETYFGEYGKKNLLLDITSDTKKGGTIDTADIPESIVDSGKIDDKIYAVAPTMTAMSTLYNSDMLKNAGVELDWNNYSYEDYVKACQQIKAKTGNYGTIDVVDNYALMQYYFRTKGEDLYKFGKDGKPEVGFKKATAIEFFQSIYDMAKDKTIPTAEVASNVKSFDENPFATGQVGFYQIWQSQFTSYTNAASDGVNISLGLPYGAVKTGALSYRPTFYYSVARTTKHKEASEKLVDFLVNNKDASKLMGTERGVPANTKVLEAIYPLMSDNEKTSANYLTSISDYVGEASPVPPVGFSAISQAAKDVYAELTYGTLTPEKAYESLVGKMKESFDENYQ